MKLRLLLSLFILDSLTACSSAVTSGQALNITLPASATSAPTPSPSAPFLPATQSLNPSSSATPPILATQKAGIKVSATNYRSEGTHRLVDVCYEMPALSNQWIINKASLEVGGQTLSFDEISLIEMQNPSPTGQNGQRCDVVSFIAPAGTTLAPATLIIDSIWAPPTEGANCDWFTTQVQPLLNARNTGVEFECNMVPNSYDIKIIRKPESMKQAEAEQIIYTTFEESITLKGPWIFSF